MIDPTTDTILEGIKRDAPTILLLGYFFYNQIKSKFEAIEKMIKECKDKIDCNSTNIQKISDQINGHLSKK